MKSNNDLPKSKIITLIGSTRFKKEYEEATAAFTLMGHIVLSVGLFGHADNLPITILEKERLDVLHYRKIDMADAVFVIDIDGYIGKSTKAELDYAEEHGKEIRDWHFWSNYSTAEPTDFRRSLKRYREMKGESE